MCLRYVLGILRVGDVEWQGDLKPSTNKQHNITTRKINLPQMSEIGGKILSVLAVSEAEENT